jgi:hypothetical protein
MLTDRQRAIVRYIATHPGASLREIGTAVGIKTAGASIQWHTHKLRQMGVIDWEPGKARTLRVATNVFVNSKGEVFKVWQPETVSNMPEIDITDRMRLCGQWIAIRDERVICGFRFFKIVAYLPMQDVYELDNDGWKSEMSYEAVLHVLKERGEDLRRFLEGCYGLE